MANNFNIGDRCRIVNTWISTEAKKKRVLIINFQENGNIIFAKVQWLGSGRKEYEEQYGILFPLDELKKI
jgi:hypothetical protein